MNRPEISLKAVMLSAALAGWLAITPPTLAADAPQGSLVTAYSGLLGSETNATSTVQGLRTGTTISLASSDPTQPARTFSAPTQPMGYGNINITLALAEKSLQQVGITDPTPEQVQAALLGGMVQTATGPVSLAGVLAARAAGMGWGEIAQSLGVKLGSIVSASARAKKADVARQKAANEKSAAGLAARSDNAKGAQGGGGSANGNGRGGNGGGGGGGNGGGRGGGRS